MKQNYELILNRTVASQMKPAQYIRTNVEIQMEYLSLKQVECYSI